MIGYQGLSHSILQKTAQSTLFVKSSRSMPFAPHLKSQHVGFGSGRCMGTSRAQPSMNQHPSVHSASTTHRTKPHHRPTHFISFPVTLPTLTEALIANRFVSTLDPASLIAPANLHITAGVLSLPTPDDLQKATALFQDHCSTATQPNHPLKAAIPHLDVMQQDPKKTHVLYARVCDISDDKPLAHLCESLRRVMMDHGYMSPENRPFKMHVTMINTVYGKKTGGTRRRIPFDATPILDALKDHAWGTVRLDSVQLMKMGRTGPAKTYESVSCFSLLK